MLTKQKEDSGLGFFLGGDDPPRFGHNGSNPGFNAVTLALCDSGEGAVFLMNANTDIETLKNILVDAVIEQYHWPGYPKKRPTPNHSMKPTQHFVVSFGSMRAPILKVLGGLSLSR